MVISMLYHFYMAAKTRKLRTRAVKDSDKLFKRAELVRIAAGLLESTDPDELAMDEVARKAKVAKGTLYLYFKTKEELALSVHFEDFREWFTDFRAFLENSQALGARELVDWLLKSMRARPRLLRMIPLVPTIFERKVPREAVRDYKVFLHREILACASLLSAKLPGTTPIDCARLMMQFHGAIIGFWSHGFPSPIALEVIEQEDLPLFRADYFASVGDLMLRLLTT